MLTSLLTGFLLATTLLYKVRHKQPACSAAGVQYTLGLSTVQALLQVKTGSFLSMHLHRTPQNYQVANLY